MEQELNHKLQPRVAFSVVSMPGDPQSLMKTGSLQTMEMLVQFLHRHIWKFSPDALTAPKQGSQAHSTVFGPQFFWTLNFVNLPLDYLFFSLPLRKKKKFIRPWVLPELALKETEICALQLYGEKNNLQAAQHGCMENQPTSACRSLFCKTIFNSSALQQGSFRQTM